MTVDSELMMSLTFWTPSESDEVNRDSQLKAAYVAVAEQTRAINISPLDFSRKVL